MTLTVQQLNSLRPQNVTINSAVPKTVADEMKQASVQFIDGFSKLSDSQFKFFQGTDLLGDPQDFFSMSTLVKEGRKKGQYETKTIKRDMGFHFFSKNKPEPIVDFLASAFFNFARSLPVWAKSIDEVEAKANGDKTVMPTPPPARMMKERLFDSKPFDVRNRFFKVSYSV